MVDFVGCVGWRVGAGKGDIGGECAMVVVVMIDWLQHGSGGSIQSAVVVIENDVGGSIRLASVQVVADGADGVFALVPVLLAVSALVLLVVSVSAAPVAVAVFVSLAPPSAVSVLGLSSPALQSVCLVFFLF